MKLVLSLFVIFTTSRLSAGDTPRLEVWTTTGDKSRLLELTQVLKPSNSSSRLNPAADVQITVDTNDGRQRISGFGAALSNAASYNLYNFTNRDALLTDLFTEKGINMDYVRLTLGASDFQAVPPYTYNDLGPGETDFNMEKFSIDKDKDFMIPLMKLIREKQPYFQIVATPWSPPAWMKDSESLFGGALKPGDEILSAHAKYLLKAMQAYKDEGFEFDTLTIQNEPLYSNGGYPTMFMDNATQREIISKHLGPAMKQAGLRTKLLAYDHNWDNIDYARAVLSDKEAAQYVAGSAWHCYADIKYSHQAAALRKEFPDKDLYFTECSGFDYVTDFWTNLYWNVHNLYFSQLSIGAKTVVIWNVALDEQDGPRVDVDGCGNCRGVVRVHPNGTYDKNVEYYYVGHFSKFMSAGTLILGVTVTGGYNVEAVAGATNDGRLITVILNPSTNDIVVDVTFKGTGLQFKGVKMMAQSVVTLHQFTPC